MKILYIQSQRAIKKTTYELEWFFDHNHIDKSDAPLTNIYLYSVKEQCKLYNNLQRTSRKIVNYLISMHSPVKPKFSLLPGVLLT